MSELFSDMLVFLHVNFIFLTCRKRFVFMFTHKTWETLQASGFPYECFAGHSYSIRTAIAAAKAGLEDSTIQLLGRWSSSGGIPAVHTYST